ncbi:hypothetical protein BKA57DRAFT_477523 [Linnemannia elongata]|nr:hypothetical protein BKA57DRAFT_477523 [Linnemannia elongata]
MMRMKMGGLGLIMMVGMGPGDGIEDILEAEVDQRRGGGSGIGCTFSRSAPHTPARSPQSIPPPPIPPHVHTTPTKTKRH